MAKSKPNHIDCGNLETLCVSKEACLSIVASAAEVFPNECIGILCCTSLPGRRGLVNAAFPYQMARRNPDTVSTDSSDFFLAMFNRSLNSRFLKMGDYHSHPFRYPERIEPLLPSEYDLESLVVGAIEIIVRVRRVKKNRNSWKSDRGSIKISWGKFRFLIKAFVRMDDDEDGSPTFRVIKIQLV